MEQNTAFLRLNSDQKIRERLLEIISEYQVRFQAMQGVGTKITNPFQSLNQVVRKYVNPLSLFLNDIRRQIEAQELTYIESLEKVALFARQTRFRDEIIAAVKELEGVEKDKPYFLYALQDLVDAKGTKERGERLREAHRGLRFLNKKYQQVFAGEEEQDVLPWRIKFNRTEQAGAEGTYYRPSAVQLAGFRNVVLNLSHNFNSDPRFFRFYHFRTRRQVKKDIIALAELLFDYGYSVERIATGRQMTEDSKYIEDILNDHLLTELEKSARRIKTAKEISHHIARLSLLNLRNIIPLRGFCRISDHQKALSFARKIEKVEKGYRIYRRIAELYHVYQRNEHCAVLKQFLNYMFSRAHYDYQSSQTLSLGGDFSKAFIFPTYFSAQEVGEKAQEEITGYSSKGKEEMLALLQLLINSLMHPQDFRNKTIAVLGDIQSGAMGQVSVGIYKGNIVALKKPAALPGSQDFSRLLRFLKHESKIHGDLVQTAASSHKNIVECYGLVQDNKTTLLALGYYPADNLENLVERNRKLSRKPPPGPWPGLTLEVIRRLFSQLTDALVYLQGKQIVHRDLKPANVLFLTDQEGVPNLIKIIDFGVAISLDPAHATDLFENKTVGTLNYMAPEQLIGKDHFKCDVYSLGAIMYALLSGRVPLSLEHCKEIKEKLRLVYRGKRVPMLEANPALQREPELQALAAIVDKTLILNPQERPDIEAVDNKLKTLWSAWSDPERLSLPIIYEKKSSGTMIDSVERTTTNALQMQDLDD